MNRYLDASFHNWGKAALLYPIAISLRMNWVTKGQRTGEQLKQSEGREIGEDQSLWMVGTHTDRNRPYESTYSG